MPQSKSEIRNQKPEQRILFSGGGTLGSVMPLLAVWESCGGKALWIGTKGGVEKEVVEQYGIPFRSIEAGKFRRYFDWKTCVAPLLTLVGFFQACAHIVRFNPTMIINAGSYVGVPVIFAGALLGKKCVVWQLDIEPSLSNRITARYATAIAVSTKEAGASFDKKKLHIVGIPVRKAIRSAEESRLENMPEYRSRFAIKDTLPVLLVIGGGTGASFLNELVWGVLGDLTKSMHVIHVTGTGKESKQDIRNERYHAFSLLRDELPKAYAIADVVITRAGMGTLSELAYFGCPSIVIPIPDSHQEKNADLLSRKNAARVLDQRMVAPDDFSKEIKKLIDDLPGRRTLATNMIGLFRSQPDFMCDLLRDI